MITIEQFVADAEAAKIRLTVDAASLAALKKLLSDRQVCGNVFGL